MQNHRMFSALVAMVPVLLLAAVLRMDGIAERTAWTDEGWTAWASLDRSLDDVLDVMHDDRHPPLFFVALAGWENVVGESRFALRMLSVLGGLLTVAVVYRTGADWFGTAAGTYGALLFAAAGITVYYSQEIRHYGWLILAVSLSSLFFLRYLKHPRLLWLVLYGASAAMVISTMYFGGGVLVIQAVIGLFIWRGTWREKLGLIGAWVLALILCAPWMLIMIRAHADRLLRAAQKSEVPFSLEPNLKNFMVIVDLLVGNQMALMVSLYLLGTGALLRRVKGRALPGLAGVYMFLAGGGLFLFMFVSSVRINTITPRTLVFVTPMVMVVAGYGLSRIQWPTRGVFAGLLTVALIAYAEPVQYRMNYTGLSEAVAADYSPGDLIILETGWDDNAFWYELQQALPDDDPAIIRTLDWVASSRPGVLRPVIPQVESDLQAHRRVWVVQWLQPPVVIPYLDEGNDGFQRVLTRTVPVNDDYYEREYADYPLIQAVLFEHPTLDGDTQTFGDLFVLQDAVIAARTAAGETLHVDLWWRAQQPPELDYSVGVYLFQPDADIVVAQHDGAPGDSATTTWTPDSFVFDRHTLAVPDNLAPGMYRIGVGVYWFGDNQPLPVDGQPFAIVGQVQIE